MNCKISFASIFSNLRVYRTEAEQIYFIACTLLRFAISLRELFSQITGPNKQLGTHENCLWVRGGVGDRSNYRQPK